MYRLLAAIALGLCLAGPACAQAGAAGAGRPIKVGAVSALTGQAAFPEASRAAKAYFDAVNAAGGVRGRRIEYLSLDEMPDPPTAARAAERLLADADVVALVGGSGLLDCAVNAKRYADAGIVSLQGASVAPECFSSPNIVPRNNGPYTGLASAVQFARAALKSRRLCVAILDFPGMRAGYQRAMDGLAGVSGQPSPALHIVPPSGDATAVLAEVAREGCDTVVYTGHEPAVLQWMAGARKLGLRGVNWVFLTPAYTAAMAKALVAEADPVYAMAEFEPWSSSSLPLLDWKRLMRQAGLPTSSLSQGGYIAALHFVKVLRSINGPVTRESVTRALREHPPVEHPMLGMPFVVASGVQHNPNRTAMPMKLVSGIWRIAAPQWIEVPQLAGP